MSDAFLSQEEVLDHVANLTYYLYFVNNEVSIVFFVVLFRKFLFHYR